VVGPLEECHAHVFAGDILHRTVAGLAERDRLDGVGNHPPGDADDDAG
jgi:hypothetical protein